MRPIIFHPKARDEIRSFPKESSARIGQGLFRLQTGGALGMPIARPMPAVAPEVSELRVRGEDVVFPRVLLHRYSKGCARVSRLREEVPADTTVGNRVGEEAPEGVARCLK